VIDLTPPLNWAAIFFWLRDEVTKIWHSGFINQAFTFQRVQKSVRFFVAYAAVP
jgi:hypothetical protein